MTNYSETVLPSLDAVQTLNVVTHPAFASSAAQVVILHSVSWETYVRLVTEHGENSGTHFTYDRGALQIMVLSAEHENYSDIISLLVNVLAEEMEIDVASFGSTTFRRKDLERGFEPDACFYVQNEALVRGKKRLDLRYDPAPDLMVEVDITSPSLNKFPLFAALNVPEVWRYDGERLGIFTLNLGQYVEQEESTILPSVTGAVLTEFIDSSLHLRRTEWLRQVRGWVRASK